MNEQWFQTLQQQQNLFGVTPEPTMAGTLPLPAGVQNTVTGALAGMFWEQAATSIFDQFGQVPGMFSPRGNVAEQFAAREYGLNKRRATQQAQTADRNTKVNFARRAAANAGIAFGAEQADALDSVLKMGDDYGITEMLASFAPDTYDALHGSRGSAAVMAGKVHSAGRFRVDPMTRRIGQSGDSAAAMVNGVYEKMYGEGADLSLNYGLGAGRMGELYTALGQRGQLGRDFGTYSREDQARMMSGDSGLVMQGLQELQRTDANKFQQLTNQHTQQTGKAPEGLKDLAGTQAGAMAAIRALQDSGNPQLEAAMRQFDATRTAQQLQSTAKAVTAMRDIFGDSGRSNVPMMELLTGLDALTQGGMVSMSAGQAERTVRMSAQIAKDAGVTIEAMQGITSASAASAEQMGLDRGFGVVAAQGAVSFGTAFGVAGEGDRTAFGRKNRDYLTQKDAQLRLQAGNSAVSNIIGAARRLNDTAEFADGSEAANLLKAINSGDAAATVRVNGEDKAVWSLSQADFNSIMTNSGVEADTAMSTLADRRANQEFSMNDKDIGLVRRMQGQELASTTVAEGFSNDIVQRAAKLGLSADAAHEFARNTGVKLGQTLLGMSVEDRTDSKKRTAILADTLLTELSGAATLTPEEEEQIQAMEQTGMAREAARKTTVGKRFGPRALLDAVAGRGGLASNAVAVSQGGEQALLDLNNQTVLEQQEKLLEDGRGKVKLATALAPLGRSSVLQRLVDQVGDPDVNLGDAVGHILGGISKDEIAAAVLPLEIEAAKAGRTGDQGMLEAMKRGGTVAEVQLQKEAVQRGVDLKTLLEDTTKTENEWDANADGLTAEQRRQLLEQGAAGLTDNPEQQRKLEELRGRKLGAQRVRALENAKENGGLADLTAKERTVRQLQSLKVAKFWAESGTNEETKTLGVDAAAGLVTGGETAKKLADKLRAGWEGVELKDYEKQLVKDLDEAAEMGGLGATAKDLEAKQDAKAGAQQPGEQPPAGVAAADVVIPSQEAVDKFLEQEKLRKSKLTPAERKRDEEMEDQIRAALERGRKPQPKPPAVAEAGDPQRNLLEQLQDGKPPAADAGFDPDGAVRPRGPGGREQAGMPEKEKQPGSNRMVISGTVRVLDNGNMDVAFTEVPGSTPVA